MGPPPISRFVKGLLFVLSRVSIVVLSPDLVVFKPFFLSILRILSIFRILFQFFSQKISIPKGNKSKERRILSFGRFFSVNSSYFNRFPAN